MSGISGDKVRPLRDRPSVVIEHRNTDELMRRLAARLGAIESRAEEITPEELPPAA
jgi:hypothetical protein